MLNWIKVFFLSMTQDFNHALIIVHNIQLYTHIKNIPFGTFMTWAFGENWAAIPLVKLHEAWNVKHSDLVKVNAVKDLSSIIFKMVDWYISINKPV